MSGIFGGTDCGSNLAGIVLDRPFLPIGPLRHPLRGTVLIFINPASEACPELSRMGKIHVYSAEPASWRYDPIIWLRLGGDEEMRWEIATAIGASQ